MEVLKCTAYEGIPLSGRHLESLRQLRANRDQPETIDHEIWMDNDMQLPKLNFFTVSAVHDLKVSIFFSNGKMANLSVKMSPDFHSVILECACEFFNENLCSLHSL